jgi:Glycosyl transferase family 1
LGYLLNPHFEHEIRTWHNQHNEHALRFFWDNKQANDEITQVDPTLSFHKLNDVEFINNMKSCKAYATTGGFESICEALYLQKPVLMVPAHIEQECNVVDAMNVGAGISDSEFNLNKLIQFTPYYQPYFSFQRWTLGAKKAFTHNLTAPIEASVKIDMKYNYIWIKALYNKNMYVKEEVPLFFESIPKSQSGYDVSFVNS